MSQEIRPFRDQLPAVSIDQLSRLDKQRILVMGGG